MSSTLRICVSIGREKLDDAVTAAQSVISQADVLEIRLDCLEAVDVHSFIRKLEKPLLFTNRPEWEGGQFAGAEEERLLPLLQAVSENAAYVDLEIQAPLRSQQAMRSALQDSTTSLILSWHNFIETPRREELLGKMIMMQDNGADIGKIITTAHTHEDVLRVLQLQEVAASLDFPLIAFCMGKPGVISRVATCGLGGYMSYCAVNDKEATAPGQLSVTALREIFALMEN